MTEELELNKLDKVFRDFIISNASPPVAKCGDIVMAQWGWKHPHKVRITAVGLELVDLNLTIGERAKLGITGRLAIEYYYIGNRLNDKDEPTGVKGAVLSSFITNNGVKWERTGLSFNNYGLCFDIDRLPELPKLNKADLEIKKDGVFDD
jgi:hypothetical protein